MRGVARELAAAGLGRLRPLPAYEPPAAFASPIAWRRTLEGKEAYLAPAVRGRFFRVERNDGSPAWLLRRLETAGAKAISPLVDLTNYFTFDLGRPLHVFDADKLEGDLTIRRARAGEALLALDENEYRLRESDLVIADGKGGGRAVAIGGVMGGLETGVTQATRRVFLEAALFDPETVAPDRPPPRESTRRPGVALSAGWIPSPLLWGEKLAAGMILRLCGGEASKAAGYGAPKGQGKAVFLPAGYTARLSGARIPPRPPAPPLRGPSASRSRPSRRAEPRVRPRPGGRGGRPRLPSAELAQ